MHIFSFFSSCAMVQYRNRVPFPLFAAKTANVMFIHFFACNRKKKGMKRTLGK